LVSQDFIPLLGLALASEYAQSGSWSWPLVAFLGVYLTSLSLTLIDTGQKRFAWGVLFVLGLTPLTGGPTAALPVLVAAYAIGYAGIRRSLEQFPWPGEPLLKFSNQVGFIPSDVREVKNRLGWPYSRLQPFKPEPAIRTEDALASSLLFAWYLYVIARAGGSEAFAFIWVVYSFSVLLMPLVRLCIYLEGHYPPISLLGRLYTRRWIIPTFDRVLLGPFAAAAAGISIPSILWTMGVGYGVSLPIATGAIAWVAMTWGPTLGEWRLTGHHRLAANRNTAIYTEA
jgi:hypothetical protein